MTKTISAHELKNRLDSGEPIHILDIRTPQEFEDFNLGGIFIPLDELFGRLDEIEHLRSQEIIVICYTGLQSFAAQAILSKRGFSHIRNLEYGLEAFLSL